MKYLFYNPYEIPNKVQITSKVLGVDKLFEEPWYDPSVVYYFDELFKMAKCDIFDDVKVYLTAHEEAYIKTKTKKGVTREPITGWVSLKGLKQGGGYLEDKDIC
ncbi:MAG: hypothetical protein J5816_00585 [Clostridia bacterium]|nr:hypothetical protein [Clostridia bacterium]